MLANMNDSRALQVLVELRRSKSISPKVFCKSVQKCFANQSRAGDQKITRLRVKVTME